MTATWKRCRALLAGVALAGCATLASEAGDDDAVRPNARAGPFRYLLAAEMGSGAPYALDKKYADYRDPTLLTLESGQVVLYAVANLSGVTGVFRFVSEDGLHFDDVPTPATPVLVPSEPWEGAVVGAPSALRVAGEVWLAYAAEGGIGIARSSDGISFTRAAQPALGADGAAGWEGGRPPAAPALAALSGDDFRLLYVAAGQIGEATSTDGTTWQRTGAAILVPSQSSLAFDAAAVSDPEVWLSTSGEGRSVMRVVYTGQGNDGGTGVGLAARYGASGPLSRAPAPVLAGPREPRSPAILPRPGHTLLFVTQRAGSTDSQAFPAIALGVAPATLRLDLR